ncbi:HEPN domain-containing protein [Janthinobacterium lividum]|uniref:HEPN domain-containing protein n=1 Tax=Janthinobacterium lividum TaxID=29581 RepID=UPI000A4C1407|nr:HEPN domain-containing protein [Janthinobacterium lividum]
MDTKQVLQARVNRKTRLDRPFANFFESFQQCTVAAELILSGSLDPRIVSLVERSAVISSVTAIEVYYRDILDFVFRYCKPDFFEPHLKLLYPEKLDIAELLEAHRNNVHPLELVSSAQSFQNTDRIDRVFSKFLGNKGLWSSVLQLQVRIKDNPSTESCFVHDELVALKRIFSLRHELVHDPARRAYFSSKTLEDMWDAAHFIFGSDIVLTQVIKANRDPKMDKD